MQSREGLPALIVLVRRLLQTLDATTRGWLTILAGDVGRMALGLVSSVIIARGLGPAHYGYYAVLAATTGIAGAVADVGLSGAAVKRVAAVRREDAALARKRGSSFFWIRVAAAGGVALAGWLLAGLLRPELGLPASAGSWSATLLLALAFVGVLASALSGAVQTLLQATERFFAISLLLVCNTGLTVMLALGLAWGNRIDLFTVLLVLGIFPALATFALSLWFFPWWRWLRPPSLSFLSGEGRRLFAFGRWLWLGNGLAALTMQLDLVLLNRLGPAATVGVYGLAANLMAKVDVLNRSLYAVLLPAASALRGGEEIRRYIWKSLLRASLVCLLLIPAAVLVHPFVLLLYGADYLPAVGFFRMLLLVVAVDIFAMPLLLLVFPLNRPQYLALVEAVRAGVLFLAASWLIPVYGAAGAAVSRLASRIAGLVVIGAFLGGRRLRQKRYQE